MPNKADGFCARVQHGGQHIVIRGRPARTFGHPEGSEGGAGFRLGLEKRAVGGVRTGPAAFDVVDAEGVERLGDLELVLGRELHALGLLAIAERGVEEGEFFFGHWVFPSTWRLLHSKRIKCNGQSPAAGGGEAPALGGGRGLAAGREVGAECTI